MYVTMLDITESEIRNSYNICRATLLLFSSLQYGRYGLATTFIYSQLYIVGKNNRTWKIHFGELWVSIVVSYQSYLQARGGGFNSQGGQRT